MKNSFLLLGIMLGLIACAQEQTAKLDINPNPALNTVRTENKFFSVQGQDLRAESYIALLNGSGADVKVIHPKSDPVQTLQETLASQFFSQGFRITSNNSNVVKVELMEALSKVDHSIFSHNIKTKVRIQITAENKKKKFVKTYSGNATDKGFSVASSDKIAFVINNLFTAVLQDIADDPKLNLFINENF